MPDLAHVSADALANGPRAHVRLATESAKIRARAAAGTEGGPVAVVDSVRDEILAG